MIHNRFNNHTMILDGDTLTYDGIQYKLPKCITKRNGHSITNIDDKVYIDGFEFKNGKFRRSLAALWHQIF